MRLMFDTEGTGLVNAWNKKKLQYHKEIDKFWVMSFKDLDTGEKYTFHHGQGFCWWQHALELLGDADELICHNQIDFDLPALKRVLGWSPAPHVTITDTLVLSRLLNPDREIPKGCKAGPHSVEAWGIRLGLGKPGIEQWEVWDPAMVNRCEKDVEIQCLIYEALKQEMGNHDWSKAIEHEHKSAEIMTRQRLSGVHFDQEYANECKADLENRIRQVSDSLSRLAPTIPKAYGVTVQEPFKTNGEAKKMVTDHLGFDHCVAGPFSRVVFDPINLNSYPQLNSWLLDVGWQPKEWNYKKVTEKESKDPESPYYGQRPKTEALDAEGNRIKSSPKLTEDSFDTIPGVIGEQIKERFRYNKRLGLITGIERTVRIDGRVPALVNPLGTNTSRMKHSVVANIPKANSSKETGELVYDTPVTKNTFYGTQCRSLFSVPEGRVLVGHDASGLELRMLAHYMNDPEYTEILLNGDIHTHNQKLAGLPTRDAAKTFIYAFNYGAGNDKLGSIVGGDANDGAAMKERFLRENPALANLIKHVKKASRKGWLKGLDGRKVPMRVYDGRVQEHKALNTLLQSAGAVVMTVSRILLDEAVKREGLDVIKVIDYHDEAQAEVHPKDVERYMELAEWSVVQAGIELNLNIPLAAEAKQGRNWAETH